YDYSFCRSSILWVPVTQQTKGTVLLVCALLSLKIIMSHPWQSFLFASLVTTLFSFICTTPSIPRSFKKMQNYNQ
ncbi:MAG: hypothetical protein SPF68_04565, partial [Sodaliphilus sp.]|nr:hypothetical protein [Sodaliphilus sp.]